MNETKTRLTLQAFEADRLRETGRLLLVRPVEPQPGGKTLESHLDGAWLGKPFKIGGESILLPKIADLPLECPYGRVGDGIRLPVESGEIEAKIIGITVERLHSLSNERAEETGVEPWYDADLRPDGTERPGGSIAYLAGLMDYIGAEYTGHSPTDPWLWLIDVTDAGRGGESGILTYRSCPVTLIEFDGNGGMRQLRTSERSYMAYRNRRNGIYLLDRFNGPEPLRGHYWTNSPEIGFETEPDALVIAEFPRPVDEIRGWLETAIRLRRRFAPEIDGLPLYCRVCRDYFPFEGEMALCEHFPRLSSSP